MKKYLFLLTVYIPIFLFGQNIDWVKDPVELVNPLMGSDSKVELSNGNTYPTIARPWGMNFWTPQTGKSGDGWIYMYDADKLRGFKQTHQASNWLGDYGQFAIMPVTGKMKFTEDARSSWFSHKSEISKPYYYSVYLADHDVTTEITPTDRCAKFRFTFPSSDSSWVIIDALDKGSYIKVIPEKNQVLGYSTKNSGSVPSNFRNYFIIQFDKDIEQVRVIGKGEVIKDVLEYTGDHALASIRFKTSRGEQVNADVTSSFIDFEQAALNLKEINNIPFSEVQKQGKKIWNKELSRLSVAGGETDQFKVFYSCLYRSLLYPRKFYEIDKRGNVVHYSPYNGKVEPGYMFTDNGFWDTFRAQFPLINLLYPEMNSQIMEGLVNAYKESGWLPEWATPGHRDCMIGSNSASIIADAYCKGVRGHDINKLYEALLKNTMNEGPLSSVGRKGVEYYNKLGYVPYDVKINESAARTLEYAYADFAMLQLAKALGRPKEEIDLFASRCMNYKNLFDKESGLMRGKNMDGKFQSPFNPFKWGDAFTEGNSWHYTWSVFHDIQGLMNLMGGKAKFTAMLDSVFVLPPIYDESYYGTVIHEIREMQISNMGQYAHGNQPIQHMIYLYNYAGVPWKAQNRLREVMNRMYNPAADGYCGDEDNGQTSAWYVFSALGFYPVCPATDQYVIGSPLFKHVQIALSDGKKIMINARNNDKNSPYIKSMKMNGASYSRNWISHKEILKGSNIDFLMSDKPEKLRGINKADQPYSFTTNEAK